MTSSSRDLAAAWDEATKALPDGYALRGVVRGPREADPPVRSASWVAFARPEADQRGRPPIVTGSGADPAAALRDLAERLSELD